MFPGKTIADRPGTRLAIAQDYIDRIVERTQDDRIGRNGKALKAPYSKVYQESLEFKAFGKSANKVNMTLTNSMLNNLDVVDNSSTTEVKIGWTPSSTDGKKAHGHVTGFEGARPKAKRDFFGLPQREIDAIARKHKDDIVSTVAPGRTVADILASLETLRRQLVEG